MRDEDLLDSVLARPQNMAAYEEPDAAALAASYGVGVAQSQAFVDGNKRPRFSVWACFWPSTAGG